MSRSLSIVRSYFRPIFGQPSWHGSAEFGSWLTINFGDPHLVVREAVPDAKARALQRRVAVVEGAHRLWVEMGAWKLHIGKRQFAHSEQSRRQLQRAAATLEGQKLHEIQISAKPLVTKFVFDEGAILSVSATHDAQPDEGLWHLYSGTRVLVLHASGELQYGALSRNAPSKCKVESLRYAA
jgi:hypothetical protein